MRFDPAYCPDCLTAGSQSAPVSMLESMQVSYSIEADTDGSFDYTGESQDWYDTAEPIEIDGRVTVSCSEGHEWQAVCRPTEVAQRLPLPDERS